MIAEFSRQVVDNSSVPMESACLVFALAVLIDAIAGDPRALYQHVPHPVVWIGQLVHKLETSLNQHQRHGSLTQLLLGTLASLVTIAATVAIAYAIQVLTQALTLGWLIQALIASSLLAGRSLHDHVRAVGIALPFGCDAARTQISHIVGRDPKSLDEAGIARAAIESAAENFVDGFVAPALWFAVFGLPGLAAYKAINTLDSMIGHRNPRYEYFGKFAARLDDLANWLPARLGALMLALGAVFTREARPLQAWSGAIRDASAHQSPNAGWPEAAMAHALNFALAGPRQYDGYQVRDPWLGDGRSELGAKDVSISLRLYRAAWVIASLALLALTCSAA